MSCGPAKREKPYRFHRENVMKDEYTIGAQMLLVVVVADDSEGTGEITKLMNL